MCIEFVRVPQPCTPPVYRYKYTINGQELGYYSLRELEVMRDAAARDLKKMEDWPEELMQHTRDYLAAIDKALNEAKAN